MKKRRSFCSLLLFIFTLSALLQLASPQGALSQISQISTRQPLPQPQVVSIQSGLQKLSPDLRTLLHLDQGQPLSQSPGVDASAPVLVSALIDPGSDVSRFFLRSARSREIDGFQWVSGEILPEQLLKLASNAHVLDVFSTSTFQTQEAPGLQALRTPFPHLDIREARRLIDLGGPQLLRQHLEELKTAFPPRVPTASQVGSAVSGEAAAPSLLDVQDVSSAWAAGYKGKDVVVAVVDTGVDFGHPDLQGAQARIPEGPYAGWPFAYDVRSGVKYALNPADVLDPLNFWPQIGETQYVSTLPVTDPDCSRQITCSAVLKIGGGMEGSVAVTVSWPNTSKSGSYLFSIHPDVLLLFAAYNLNMVYPNGWTPAVVIVSDEHTPGIFDTVYVDVNYNGKLGDPGEMMTQSQPLGGVDLDHDGTWDLSAGMLAWISDGVHHPPGVAALYPQVAQITPPARGGLLAFINDKDGHGTNCASEVAGRMQITDPQGLGPTNPLYAGAGELGGAGTPVIPGMAPEASIAAFENGFDFPLDAWTLAVIGMDEDQDLKDGAQIISNSWGDSYVTEDGWDPISRFAQHLSYEVAPSVSFLAATGNGGHGYGTETLPGGGSIIDVGASTAYGQLKVFEGTTPDQFLSGEVQPWSNRGPGALGEIAPDVVAVGAWGTGAQPLNSYYGDGQAAYDVFGGTSMSTPITAGSLALVYQAFRAQPAHPRWPTWDEARSLLFNGAKDLGYDVFTQGAGIIQAGRSVAIATGSQPWVDPPQWHPGSYRGEKYPAFPGLIHSGEEDSQEFSIHNPTGENVDFQITQGLLKKKSEETFTIAYSPPAPTSKYSLPVFLEDITSRVAANNPDLVRAQVTIPYSSFDINGDGNADNWWSVFFYDWTDHNQDHNLWVDDNHNGMVDEKEIDFDKTSRIYEFNRFTYGYPQSTTMEASLGRQGITQRHDGIFLGLSCYYCGESVTFQIRLTFYEKTDWLWLSLSHSALTVPAQGQAAFSASFAPVDASPGVYESSIELHSALGDMTIPLVALIAADSATFQFGGAAAAELPYDNGKMFGGFNWNWRYESGDWRFYYYDLPDGMQQPGKALLVDTRWSVPKTDIDTWVLGKPSQPAEPLTQSIFGPQGLAVLAESVDTHLGNGEFAWKTNTGTTHELVGLPLRDGLGLVALHNVLTGGGQPIESFNGSVFQFTSEPGQAHLDLLPVSAQAPYLIGSQEFTFTSTGDIPEGVQVRAYGMSVPEHLINEPVKQNQANSGCSATWVYHQNQGGLKISHGGLLEITTSAENPALDVDLYLFQDDGDGVWNCNREKFINYSISDGPDEHIKMFFPEDGVYWIAVLGKYVPRAHPQFFNIDINAVQGTQIRLRNLPSGALYAGQPVHLQADFESLYASDTPAALEGMLLIGPPSVPTLLEIPLTLHPTILIYPQPVLSVSSSWIRQAPQVFQLSFINQGVQDEEMQIQVTLPAGLVYAPGSASAQDSVPIYDDATRTLSWVGSGKAGEKTTLSFSAAAQPGFAAGSATLHAHVLGSSTGQEWNIAADVWLNSYGVSLPVMRR